MIEKQAEEDNNSFKFLNQLFDEFFEIDIAYP